MSVRFDATTDYYLSSASPPGATYTVCLWAKIVVDRNDFQAFWSCDTGSATNATTLATASDGTTLAPYSQPGNTTLTTGFNMTVGAWYRLALVRNSTAVTAYWADATGSTSSASATMTSFTATEIQLGGDIYATTDWLNGSIANVKQYSAVLTQAEIEAEWVSWTPVRTSGLVRHHRFDTAASTADDSGNGNTLTANGTPTFDSDNPSWTPSQLVIPVRIFQNP